MLYRAPMNHLNLYNKFKRLNTLEASVTIVGILLLTSCLLCSLFYLNDAIINGRETTLRSSDDELTWWFGVNVTENSKFGNLDKSSDENDEKNCDFYDGKWVYDETYPLYDTKDCYFAEGAFGCVHNGRPNNSYTKWRWQPNNCNMPRFDAKLMLEKLRNKRVVFVGDSIGRNQWESLLCMLSSAVSNKSSIYEVNGNPITKHMGFLVFMFQDYNCTVEYYRSPFLVVQNRPPPGSPRHVRYSLKIDKMDWNSNKYKDADVLIFNAGHWWTDDKTINSGCYFEEGHKLKMNMTVKTAFKRSIETLASWVDSEVNLSKTSIFFRSYAPVHYSYGTWKTGGSCHLHTQPDFKAPYLPYTWGHFSILNEALADYASKSNNVTKIELLDVTYLSVQRRDGHISIYSRGPTTPAPLHRQDCSHWCLPGVPDTWNELLYAVLHSRNFTIA